MKNRNFCRQEAISYVRQRHENVRLAFAGVLVLFVCTLTGCPKPENDALVTLEASQGAIQSAQAQYLSQCKINGTLGPCRLIDQAVDLQNIAVSSLDTYCGWPIGNTLPANTCIPNKSAVGALNIALANLSSVIVQVKALLAKPSPTP